MYNACLLIEANTAMIKFYNKLLMIGDSVEHLQRKLSSMLTENQSYREMNRDKDQQLERDKVGYNVALGFSSN